MVRELDLSKPLSAEDVEHLRSRYSDAYVDRMVALAGGAEELEEVDESQNGDETADEGSEGTDPQGEGSEDADGADEGSSEDDEVEDDESDADESEEDLLGEVAEPTSYDPTEKTVKEVQAELDKVSDADFAVIVEREKDGRGRSSILNYKKS